MNDAQDELERLRARVAELEEPARRWRELCARLGNAASGDRMHPPLRRMVESMFAARYGKVATRTLYDSLPRHADAYGLHIYINETDIAEWDDRQANKCGQFLYRTFRRWRKLHGRQEQ